MATPSPKKRQRGRPFLGERVPLSLRVTPEIKLRLAEAAKRSGRSQSQEAELRLERSFDRSELLRVLAEAGFVTAPVPGPARKIGAPPKRTPKPGERFQMGVRVTPQMKAALDEAAAASGRSQSQETELRLEQSFNNSALLRLLAEKGFI
jgi:uncharacterized protein (DUF1778 family)